MKKSILTVFSILALSFAVHSQTSIVKARNTIAVSEGDSKETIIAKAAHVIPKANQLAALQNEFIEFIHFGPKTLPQKQHANGMMGKGIIIISADGVNWQDVETFEFGNLVND